MSSSKEYSVCVDFIEKFPIVGVMKAFYHLLAGNKQKFRSCLRQQSKILIKVVKFLPGLGHITGIICYCFNKKELGDSFIKPASRTLIGVSSGAVYGLLISKTFDDLFNPIKLNKELFICSLLGFSLGLLFDYANSFQKTISISESKDDFSVQKTIDLNFPYGLVKNYDKFLKKPNKRTKNVIKMGFRAILYVGSGMVGFYFCSKVEKTLYSSIYAEVGKYLAFGTCALILLF